jgi:hypothetical protein
VFGASSGRSASYKRCAGMASAAAPSSFRHLSLNSDLKIDPLRTAKEIKSWQLLAGCPPASLLTDLGTLSACISSENPLVCRKSDIYSEPDRSGYRAQYPSHDFSGDQLLALSDSIDELISFSPCFAATVVLCGIFTAHPFSDGNGRAGRVMFNHIVREELGTDFYLPIYELAAASAGGWLVAIRQIQLRSNWTPVSEFLLYSTKLF